MKTKYIKVNLYTDIINLVRQTANVTGDVTLKKGKYVVDAKSLMGVMSLDLSTGVTVEYPEVATDFEEYISQFNA